MSIINVNDININYKLAGEGKSVVLLHGWGQNLKMMDYIFNHLKNNFKVLSIDFAGFGESDLPNKAFSVQDYSDNLEILLEKLDIENPIIIAHSFGCRVAIRYSVKNKVNKMILTGAAGIKEKRSLIAKVKLFIFKFLKKILLLFNMTKTLENLQNKFGSSDYKNSSGVMRETFIKVVNDDISDILKDIECPVLLVWGENDEATPLKSGKIMEEKIKDSALVVFENDDHFAYFHQYNRFNLVIDAMLKEDI